MNPNFQAYIDLSAYMGETLEIAISPEMDIVFRETATMDIPGQGLELCAEAFMDWVESVKKRFPEVVFEGCASGGLRMDYRSLSAFSLMSTSDQTDYLKYPYIAGNILSAVIPEQAAVWSYPVGECSREEINDDQIIMNMVNSFLGRMHLASHLEWMNEHQLEFVKEGVGFYKTLSDAKKRVKENKFWCYLNVLKRRRS